MKLIFDSGVKAYNDADGDYKEQLRIFEFEEDDNEDFELLSHNEKIAELGIEKEGSTPNKDHGSVVRHNIDNDSMSDYVIVTTNTISW